MVTKLFDTRMGMNPDAWSFMHKLADLEPHTAEFVKPDDKRVALGRVFDPGYQIETRVRPFHNGRERGFVLMISHPSPSGFAMPWMSSETNGGRRYKSESTCIAFFSHRNCGEGLCAVKWEDEDRYPADWYTFEDFPEGTTKYNYIELKDEWEAQKLVLDAIAEYAEPLNES